MMLQNLKTLSTKKFLNSYDNTIIGVVYSTTEPRCIITKAGNTLYVRDIVLVDESKFGFTVKEWMGQNHYKSIYSNDGGKIITSNTNTEYNLKRGDVVLYRMVNIRCKKRQQYFGTITSTTNTKFILPETTVYYRFGSLVKKPIVIRRSQKKFILSNVERRRMVEINNWAKINHPTLLSIDYDIFHNNTRKKRKIDDEISKKPYKKKNHISNSINSLEMLTPNRNQTFTALLKDIKVHKKKDTSIMPSTGITANKQTDKDYIVLIFSDEDHVEVAIKCVQPYFQSQNIINQLLNFKNCVCRVENVFVKQAPFVNKNVAGMYRDQMQINTTMRTNIYCLEYFDTATQNVLIDCGRLKPLFHILGYICELKMSNELLKKLINDDLTSENQEAMEVTNNKKKSPYENEYCMLYIKMKDTNCKKKKQRKTNVVALSLTPSSSSLIQIKVSLNIVSNALLNGISLTSLFQHQMKKPRGNFAKHVEDMNKTGNDEDVDAKFLLGWRMLSSIMKTPLSQVFSTNNTNINNNGTSSKKINDDNNIINEFEKPLMCFVVTKEGNNNNNIVKNKTRVNNSKNDNDITMMMDDTCSMLRLVDMKIM